MILTLHMYIVLFKSYSVFKKCIVFKGINEVFVRVQQLLVNQSRKRDHRVLYVTKVRFLVVIWYTTKATRDR